MARELSQEELLDFLCQAGGRVTNAALLGHFKHFLRDPSAAPGQLQQRRELFKSFVNSVAAVRQDPDGTKCVVLKKRYRDLVGEEGLRGHRGSLPATEPPQQQTPRSPRAPAASPGSVRPAPRLRQQPQSQQQPPSQQQQSQTQTEPQPRLQPQPQPHLYQPRPRPQQYQQQSQPQEQQPQRARRQPREKESETEPAGARTPASETECNGLWPRTADAPESTETGRRRGGGRSCSPKRLGEEAAPACLVPQARVRCTAEGALGGSCWECAQDSPLGRWTEPLLLSHGSPPLEEQQALEPSSGRPLEGILNSSSRLSPQPSQVATALLPPQETCRASVTSPSLASPLVFPGDGSGLLTRSGPHSYSVQQQQRTREWVANHSQPSLGSVAERTHQGPSRSWCVLPENFPQLPNNWSLLASEKLPPPLSASSLQLSAGSSIFRSIRCQLDLQDLENFVEEDSHDSEESTSGPRESPGELEDTPKVSLENGGQEDPSTQPGHFIKSQQENIFLNKSQGLIFRNGHSLQHIPGRANGPVVISTKTSRDSFIQPQDSMPWPIPRLKRSLRRSSRAGRDKISSSDEELLDEDLVKRNRRPPRSRKLSRVGAVPCPKVDAPLALMQTDPKALSEQRLVDNAPSVLVSLRPSVHKSSLVPLDSREHEWIVRLASGSWVQVLTLFWEDPQLALRKDFLTGYTALHWIAKHGDLQALQDLVKGAQKAGIILDMNVRSSCGYTPLHLAAIHGHQSIIKLLVQRLESSVNVRDSSGKKPWQYLTSNTTGEIWQLLGAPKGKPIFPVYSLVRSSSPTRRAKNHDISRNISRKTSFAALLKSHHSRWKMAHQYDKFRSSGEREDYSD
ncbi:ankyrin repeat domain-containing protein SOWAHB [Gracilinanus agilis]|uniref:ankyrin repeat domain-containing protein SOWAHB n=1 Tax=Gracilinanus agilis TaxID=191870 RepID=UPI001CFC8871|nr:ankyrin repeat domain-containing protein SOWAHB [Gracilinanus agilis]